MLAHVGCYVPAKWAYFSALDRLFTRFLLIIIIILIINMLMPVQQIVLHI
jgi:hypothetical protein